MNSKAFNEIIQLNKAFYAKIGEEFSKTRQSPWSGWSKSLFIIRELLGSDKAVKIADLGCGNGRLLKFFLDNKLENFEYYGYDSDSYLLSTPTEHYDVRVGKFEKLDVILDLDKITQKFDVICVFGLVHHIPSLDFRIEWFKKVISKLNSGGMFIFTTWNYDRDGRFAPAKNKFRNIKDDLEDGDYFIGWNNLKDVHRYIHIYSESEIKRIIDLMNVKLISKYSSDGKNGNLNDYYIVKKR